MEVVELPTSSREPIDQVNAQDSTVMDALSEL